MNIKNYLLITALMFSPLMTQTNDAPDAPETEISEPKKWIEPRRVDGQHVLPPAVTIGGTVALLFAINNLLGEKVIRHKAFPVAIFTIALTFIGLNIYLSNIYHKIVYN